MDNFTLQSSPTRANYLGHSDIPGYGTEAWTPILDFNGGTTGITYGQQYGQYVTVGNLIFAFYKIVLTSKGSSTGSARLGNLPLRTASSSGDTYHKGQGGFVSYWQDMTSALITIVMQMGSNHVFFRGGIAGAVTLAVLTDTDFSDTTEICGTIIYTNP